VAPPDLDAGRIARQQRAGDADVDHIAEQVLARMVGLGYIMDAARSVTTAAIDNGEKPAVPAAILK